MFRFFTKSVMRRLSILFLLGALIPIAFVGWLSFRYSRAALAESAFSKLTAVREIKKNQIIGYFKERMGDIEVLAEGQDALKAFTLLNTYSDAGGMDPNGFFDVTSVKYKQIYEKIDPFFRKYINAYGYHDIFFICNESGHVMYSAARENDLGTNLKMGEYKDAGLALLWKKVLNNRKTAMVDFTDYAPSGKPAAFIGTPVKEEKEGVVGVLALQINTEEINAICIENAGMGRTGESYLVGSDFLMRSDSRFEKNSTILKHKVDTVAVREALEGQTGAKLIKDYRGVDVLCSYSHLGLDKKLGTDFDWAIIAEIDKSEAFAPIKLLQNRILWVGLIFTALACMIGYFSSRSIAGPLATLSGQVAQMADGDLTITITPDQRSDEVGVLINAFGNMLQAFRNQTQQITEGVQTIASSISEISTTSIQLASSASETSTSVSEITTTVEEVRQTSQLANEKAEDVSKRADDATRISGEGEKAAEDAGTGMNRIKKEMDYVAESIVELSEQTQSIGEIISAVNDLADQSNLLSVNASIEAAKAGEHGKGFAVVAQEVKSLADQSKEATAQVKTILNDIQKATGTAVMATEKGSKAVETGENLAAQSGDSIRTLSNNIRDSAESASQITVSSQQQLVGLEQLVQAMESIKEASMQNVEGAQQLESAVKNLDDVGQELKGLAEKFKV